MKLTWTHKERITCPVCKGTGEVELPNEQTSYRCPVCDGIGEALATITTEYHQGSGFSFDVEVHPVWMEEEK